MPAPGFVRVRVELPEALYALIAAEAGEGQEAFNATLTEILLGLVPEAERELALLPPVPGRH